MKNLIRPTPKALVIIALLAVTSGIAWKLSQKSELRETDSGPMAQTSAATTKASTTGERKDSDKLAENSQDESETSSVEKLEARALRDLPTKRALQRLSAEEVHHTPALLMRAAAELGDVAEAFQRKLKQTEGDSTSQTQVLQEGIVFYRECLNSRSRPDSIRALCYTHYREFREKSGDPERQDEADAIPVNVRSLADFLADR
jgi:hypothetical protein